MSVDPTETCASDIREARAALIAHDALVATEETRLAHLQVSARGLRSQFDQVAADIAERNLQATLADRPLPEEDPRQAKELRRLQATIQATEAAIPVLERTIAQLRAQRPGLRIAISRAFWPWKAEILQSALASVRDAYSAMSEPIASLVALDELQGRLLGSDFVTDASVDRTVLISSGRLMERLLDGIPKQCRPPSLDPGSLDALSAERVANFTRSLETNA